MGLCKTLAFTLIKQEPVESSEQRNNKIHFIFYNDHFNCCVENRLQVGMGKKQGDQLESFKSNPD